MFTFKKRIITGCEERGDYDKPYLTRYTFFETKNLQIALHIFHRSDANDLHDHPWNFVSLILWRGYIEETFEFNPFFHKDKYRITRRKQKRYYPGQILIRKAEHAHRVQLINGKKAITLVFMSRYIRQWGFFTKNGWSNFIDYFKINKC